METGNAQVGRGPFAGVGAGVIVVLGVSGWYYGGGSMCWGQGLGYRSGFIKKSNNNKRQILRLY